MNRIHPVCNIETPLFTSKVFLFLGYFTSVLSITVTEASFRKSRCDPHSENVYISDPAYMAFSYKTFQHCYYSYPIFYETDL